MLKNEARTQKYFTNMALEQKSLATPEIYNGKLSVIGFELKKYQWHCDCRQKTCLIFGPAYRTRNQIFD
jgi:hypothetical protein